MTESERTWARGTRNAASANFEWDEKKKFRVRKREGEREIEGWKATLQPSIPHRPPLLERPKESVRRPIPNLAEMVFKLLFYGNIYYRIFASADSQFPSSFLMPALTRVGMSPEDRERELSI